jgi:hypothetical protein
MSTIGNAGINNNIIFFLNRHTAKTNTGPLHTLPPLLCLLSSMLGIHVPLVTEFGTSFVASGDFHGCYDAVKARLTMKEQATSISKSQEHITCSHLNYV